MFEKRITLDPILLLGIENSGKKRILSNILPKQLLEFESEYPFKSDSILVSKRDSLVLMMVPTPYYSTPNYSAMVWRLYCARNLPFILVIDSTRPEKFSDLKVLLHEFLEYPEMRNVHFVIFANKQDLPDACSREEIIRGLDLRRLGGIWEIIGTNALTGEGLKDGFNLVVRFAKVMKDEKKIPIDGITYHNY